MKILPNRPWAPLWHSFAERCLIRLHAGASEYGDKSFSRSPIALAREIREEVADQVTWSFILDRRLGDLIEHLVKLGKCPHCGGKL